jgi:membrane protein
VLSSGLQRSPCGEIAASTGRVSYPFRMPNAYQSVVSALRQWVELIDRERITQFFRFLLKRFIDDRCFESAGALAYTTMFALVPFTAVVLAVLSAFPAFDTWTTRLAEFVFSNFVPASARAVEQYLRDYAISARHLTSTGIVALVVSVLLTMWSIEQAFNRIWRVPAAKPKLSRFLMYWTLLTLGSLLMVWALPIDYCAIFRTRSNG